VRSGAAPVDPKEGWERRWRGRRGPEFHWFTERAPKQLDMLIEGESLLRGRALDLGCGPGVITSHLARAFPLAFGIDIAHEAVEEASRRQGPSDVAAPLFAVADAVRLPFTDGSFVFVFDRGCLQNTPRAAWPAYFREVERVVAPGGTFQVLASNPSRSLRDFPQSWVSRRGLRKRVLWLLGKRAGFEVDDLLRRFLPHTMEIVAMEDIAHPVRPSRTMTHAILRKRDDAAA
jgi:ubiquinone/menaquinone biosynthesis C-methylase UbiE